MPYLSLKGKKLQPLHEGSFMQCAMASRPHTNVLGNQDDCFMIHGNGSHNFARAKSAVIAVKYKQNCYDVLMNQMSWIPNHHLKQNRF